MCKYYVNLQWESACVEKGHEILVETLKVKICRDVIMNEKDEQLEAEDVRKEVDRDFFYTIDEDMDESEEESESAEELESEE